MNFIKNTSEQKNKKKNIRVMCIKCGKDHQGTKTLLRQDYKSQKGDVRKSKPTWITIQDFESL